MRPHDLSPAAEPWASALLLHPHPDMGGDRFNVVVGALYAALPPAGVTAVRFDFSSSVTESAVADTIEMLDALPIPPRYLVGYSFGAGIAAIVDDARVDGRVLIAPPTSIASSESVFVIRAQHDQFFAPEKLGADVVVGGADHFFIGRTDEVVEQTLGFLRRAAH